MRLFRSAIATEDSPTLSSLDLRRCRNHGAGSAVHTAAKLSAELRLCATSFLRLLLCLLHCQPWHRRIPGDLSLRDRLRASQLGPFREILPALQPLLLRGHHKPAHGHFNHLRRCRTPTQHPGANLPADSRNCQAKRAISVNYDAETWWESHGSS